MEINIYAAKTHLSRLIDQVNADEEVIITLHGRRLRAWCPPRRQGRASSGCFKVRVTGWPTISMLRCRTTSLTCSRGKRRNREPRSLEAAFVWSQLEPSRLPARLRAILIDPAHSVHVSAASIWEVAIKSGLGKLSFPLDQLAAIIDDAGFSDLPVISGHALDVRHLPLLHRDPFDRLLIAQARHERLTLVTQNADIRRYPVDTLWD
jgi:PIN domain nuclease of toxin-antitoxin system/antitoxin (DNA-binding transcriptional repressor) of toxin-antitoxin stability system